MILVLAAALADLCGPVPAAASQDPADAASYVQVGDDAAAGGDARVAAIAYRKALALDPANAHARAALDTLCRADRARSDDGSDLLVAIAHFRAGDLDEARRELRALAARHGPSEGGAHFFLGLVALQEHDGAVAAAELELARRDPAYADLAAPVLRLAHRDGIVAARLLLAGEVDTNPQLLPDTPPAGATTGAPQPDLDALAVASVTVRPAPWLFLRDTLAYRDQVREDALDFLGENAQAGLELAHGPAHVELRYDLDYDLLAGSPYLVASRGTLAYRHELGVIALVASYALRRRDYRQASVDAFTGFVHDGEAGMIVHATPALDLDARVLAVRELTSDATFANWAAGGRLAARARLAPGFRLAASATGWYATYDAAQPDGLVRHDLHGEAAADAELDLGDYTLATCGGAAIGNTSDIEDFRYWKLVFRCGLAVAFGAP